MTSEFTPTRSAFLALREEREGMREGYRFLDEKRVALAAEILTELKRYEIALGRFRAVWADAARALQGAVGRHGVSGLGYYPPQAQTLDLSLTTRSVLGVPVVEAQPRPVEPPPANRAVDASPEGEHCRGAFGRLLPEAARLAAMAGNLERLRVEYQRTSRRARALEDVLLPEIERTLKGLEGALEEQDTEEAVRVRYARR